MQRTSRVFAVAVLESPSLRVRYTLPMDDLAEKIARATSELEAALGEQKGQIDFELEYREEVTVSGDRIGFARLAVELLKVATPPAISDLNQLPTPDDRLLSSPIADYKRSDASAGAAPVKMSWKDRLIATGCLLFGGFAVAAFFRGCAALEHDLQRFLK